jgi:hypothetical protein
MKAKHKQFIEKLLLLMTEYEVQDIGGIFEGDLHGIYGETFQVCFKDGETVNLAHNQTYVSPYDIKEFLE